MTGDKQLHHGGKAMRLACIGIGSNAIRLLEAQWEQEGKLKAVITQNIDNLH